LDEFIEAEAEFDLYEKQFSEHFDKGEYDKAIEDAYNIRHSLYIPIRILMLGMAYEAKQEYERAKDFYLLALDYNNNSTTQERIDHCQKMIDQTTEIKKGKREEDQKNSLYLNDTNNTDEKIDTAEFYFNIGCIKYYKLEDYNGALQEFDKSIEIKPDYAFAYLVRSFLKKELNDQDGALQDYNKAVSLKWDFVALKTDNLIAKLRNGAQQDDNIKRYNDIGMFKYKIGDYVGAIQEFNKEIILNPNNANFFMNRATMKAKLSDFRRANQDLDKAIELKPDFKEAYYNRGLNKLIINDNDKEGACLDWSKAGELGYSEAYELIREYCN